MVSNLVTIPTNYFLYKINFYLMFFLYIYINIRFIFLVVLVLSDFWSFGVLFLKKIKYLSNTLINLIDFFIKKLLFDEFLRKIGFYLYKSL